MPNVHMKNYYIEDKSSLIDYHFYGALIQVASFSACKTILLVSFVTYYFSSISLPSIRNGLEIWCFHLLPLTHHIRICFFCHYAAKKFSMYKIKL